MATHSGDGFQKVMSGTPNSTSMARVANTPAGESFKPASAKKTGISFVIPKNKLSGALVPVLRNGAGIRDSNASKKEDVAQPVPVRKTRWGADLTQDSAVKRGRALALQTRAEQIAAQLESGHLDIDSNDLPRSPSPPPVYDLNGQRINTREGRRREQLERERREAIGECLQLNPHFKTPPGYKPICREAKLYIPAKDYPGYNFIGLILGPRGNTQKRMEAETGTKIAIRGKGAAKEGKVGRRDVKDAEGAFEDLHVHITADSIDKVDAAVALIEPLLTPVDDDRNTHKRKQLRELAEMNGTTRDLPRVCSLCGESSHREWHCPKEKMFSIQRKANLFCQICGDGGHPTIDCLNRQTGQAKGLDREYLNFLEELGDGLAGPNPGSTQAQSPQLPAEETAKEEKQTASVATRTTSTPGVSNETPDSSRDPNQLADVVQGQQAMLITASGPQPVPSAWATVGVFPNGFESRLIPREGVFLPVDGIAQLQQDAPSGLRLHMEPPNSAGFNGNVEAFMYPGLPPSVGSTPAMNAPRPLHMRPVESSQGSGPPHMQPMGSGFYGRENVLQATDMSSSSGKFLGQHDGGLFPSFPITSNGLPFGSPSHTSNSSIYPSLLQPNERDPSAPSPSLNVRPFDPSWNSLPSSRLANPLGQNINPQNAISGSTHAHPPPPFWGNGSAVQQQPPPPWGQTGTSKPSEQNPWGNGSSRSPLAPMTPVPSIFPISVPAGVPPTTSSVEGPSPSWSSRHTAPPLPTRPPLPPQPLSLLTNQPWKVSPPEVSRQDTFSMPRPSSTDWRGTTPNIAAVPLPLPQTQGRRPPHILGALQNNQLPPQLHPPRLQQAGPNSELSNVRSTSGPTVIPNSRESPDFNRSLTTWTQQIGGDRTAFESCTSSTVPAHLNVTRLQTPYQSHDPFFPTGTPALANVHPQRGPLAMIGGLSSTNVHPQQVTAMHVLNVPANAGVPQQHQQGMPPAGPPNTLLMHQHQALVQMHGVASISNLHPPLPGIIPRLSIPSNPNVHQPQAGMPVLHVSGQPSAQAGMALPMLRSPTNASIQQHKTDVSVLGMASPIPVAFGVLPEQVSGKNVLSDSSTRRDQPPLPAGRPPWHYLEPNSRLSMISPGPPAMPQPVPGPAAAVETDAEYEKLMASVGVK